MDKIVYKMLYIEGFQGILGPLYFNLQEKGIVIMSGENGIGKTTIISAFLWCQFGITTKKYVSPEPWENLRNRDNYKGTHVYIEFTKGSDTYVITRCKDYKGKVKGGSKPGRGLYLSVYKNDEEVLNTKDRTMRQNFIDNILGYTGYLFKNSIIFCQKATRVLSMGGADRKNLFEDIFDISFIELAIQKANEQYSSKNQEYITLKNKVDSINNILDNQTNSVSTYKSLKEDYIQQKKDNINLESKLKQAKEQLDKANSISVKDNSDFISAIEEKIAKITNRYISYQRELGEAVSIVNTNSKKSQELVKELTKLKNSGDICPTCGSKLKDATHIKNHIKELKEELIKVDKLISDYSIIKSQRKEETQELKEKIDKLYSKLDSLKKKNHEMNNKVEMIKAAKEKISHLEFRKESLIKAKKRYKEEKERYLKTKEKISKLNNELSEIKPKLQIAQKWVEAYSWVLKDPLSNKGIRPYILQGLIENLNKILETYSGLLGFQIILDFNLTSASKEINTIIAFRDGTIAQYEELSGGQQQLADLVTLLSINELRNSTAPVSVMFLDELFESLCQDNVSKVFDILLKRSSNGDSIFIITHNEDFKPSGSEILYFSKTRAGEITIDRL